MNTKLYLKPPPNKGQWRKFGANDLAEPGAATLSFLYLGDDKSLADIISHKFHAGFIADSMGECTLLYNDLPRDQYPEVIFIDIEFNRSAMRSFQQFLNQKKIFRRTIVIYNASRLKKEDISYIKQNELVDDVVKLSACGDNLVRKILFLKKVKTTLQPRSRFAIRHVGNAVSTRRQGLYLKRIVDIVFASIALVLLLPVFLLIAIAIKLDSPGPVIYSSLRAGRGFRIFKFYKFRTMIVGADKKIEEFAHLNQYHVSTEGEPKFVKIANDPRITRLGHFLRNTSIDELPQFINVLIGDMSLVGNRPLPLYEASTLTTNEHVERFMAPAGITGLWQIEKRGKSEMSVEERISLDISYARRYSMLYDMWIVARTPAALLQKSNA